MPSYRCSTSDGHYFVNHFYKNHATWQLKAEGVRFLEFLKIKQGDHFTTDLFMVLFSAGLVHTGNHSRTPAPVRLVDHLPFDLVARAKEFHIAAVEGGESGAERCLRIIGDGTKLKQRLEPHLSKCWRKSSWGIAFGVVGMESIGSERIGLGRLGVDFSWLRGTSSALIHEVWVKTDNWYLVDVEEWSASALPFR